MTCGKCGNYLPGHATGAGDICTCKPEPGPVRRYIVEFHDGVNTRHRTDDAMQIKGMTKLLSTFAEIQTEGTIPAVRIIRDEAP